MKPYHGDPNQALDCFAQCAQGRQGRQPSMPSTRQTSSASAEACAASNKYSIGLHSQR